MTDRPTIPAPPGGLDAPPAGYGPPPRRRRRFQPRKGRTLVAILAALAVVVIGGPLVFFHLIEGSAPGRLSLPAVTGAARAGVTSGPVSGTWKITTGSQAGFRVQEILFGQHHTAVGRTTRVTGGFVIAGTEVTAADFTVNVSSINTDQAGRNDQFHGRLMETYKYPTAAFRLTRVIRLGAVPPAGRVVAATGVGLLSMRGQTRPVEVALKAERVKGGIDVTGDIPITFSHWHIPNPSFAVAQVGNTGLVEVLLHLVRDR